jgi:hypothetical protein
LVQVVFELLNNRSQQQVSIDGTLSKRFDLDSGVPQGSCLGPLLLIIYASKLFKVIEVQLPDAHGYADDTQLYLSFKPNADTSQQDAVRAMENCVEKIRCWMIHDKLLMNDGKTEFMLIGTRQQLSKLQPINISVSNSEIHPSSNVKNCIAAGSTQTRQSGGADVYFELRFSFVI